MIFWSLSEYVFSKIVVSMYQEILKNFIELSLKLILIYRENHLCISSKKKLLYIFYTVKII